MSFEKEWNSEIARHENCTGEQYDEVIVIDEDGKQVCTMIGDDKEWIQNACLIAEAPRIYHLLRELKSFIQDLNLDSYDIRRMESFVNEINNIDEKISIIKE